MKPSLRYLEFRPVEHEGQKYFHAHDRYEFSDDVFLPRAWAGVLQLLDGTRDVETIIRDYATQHGETLPREAVEAVLEQLDEALVLDSPRFRERQAEVVRAFEDASTRASSCAGRSYPNDADALKKLLDGFFAEAATIEVLSPRPESAELRGIVVPHIDFTRGGVTEALAYRQLHSDFDTFIVLGIAHAGVHYPFCATDKDFDTPLGVALCDRVFLHELNARAGGKMLLEQYAHKTEHSIEFVAVFLQAMPQHRNAQIVPIACGGFFEELRTGASPLENPDIAEFVEALRETVHSHQAQGKKIGLVASVDLAHVGSNFGDDEVLTPARLAGIKTQDLQFLQAVEAGDLSAVHAVLARDNNTRNVDAHPAVFTLLAAFPELRAQLLDYRQTFDKNSNSVVSFAAMSLWNA
jgi:AmmeMemoRadiSam system protein B